MQLSNTNSLGLKNFVIDSKSDLSCYVYYHSLNVLRQNGRLGFIVGDGWMSFGYGQSLQKILLNVCSIEILMRLKINVFEDADIKTIITIFEKKKNIHNNVKLIHARNNLLLNIESIDKQQDTFVVGNWNPYFTADKLFPKIKMIDICDVGKIKQGIKTGCNDFFILTNANIQKYNISLKYRRPIIHKNLHSIYLNNDDIKQYLLYVSESKNQLLKSKDGTNIFKYIELQNIEITPKNSNSKRKISELQSVKNHNPWYHLKLGNPPSIIFSEIINKKMRIYENNGMFYAKNTFIYFTPKKLEYVDLFLCYLSSSWFSLYQEKNGKSMGGGALKFQISEFQNSPVPDFDKMPKEDVLKMKKIWKEYREDFNQEKLDDIILQILGFTNAEKKDIVKKLNLLVKRRTDNTTI